MEIIQKKDLIYGYKDGMALIMDFITTPPKKSRAIVWIASGAWMSNPEINKFNYHPNSSDTYDIFRYKLLTSLLENGYSIFSIQHSSTPKYSINEITPDIGRAIRFIRAKAKEYAIIPDKIGIIGTSSGGHLSLMAATNPRIQSLNIDDPIDQQSSEIQAAVAFFPPTDFLNYGKKAFRVCDYFDFKAPFDFHKVDEITSCFERIVNNNVYNNFVVASNNLVLKIALFNRPIIYNNVVYDNGLADVVIVNGEETTISS